MTEQEVQNIIHNIFIEEFEIEESKLHKDALIFDTLGLDSLDIVDLVVALEKAFEVKIKSRESIQKIRTIGDIYQFILSHPEKENNAS